MLQLPRPPAGGDAPSASWARMIVAYVRAITPRSGPRIHYHTTANGTTPFIGRPGISSGAAASELFPFDIILTAQVSPSTNFDATFVPGVINQNMPSNMFSAITYDPTTKRYFKLRVLSDGKSVTSCSLVMESGSTTGIVDTLNACPTSFDILIAIVDTGTIYQVTEGNITATPRPGITVQRASPAPGEVPYDFYYGWAISTS